MNPRSDVINLLRQVFGDKIETLDSAEPLRLQPIAADCEGADAKDPSNCILVHTAKRMFGTKSAVFWRKWAYLDLITPKDRKVRLYRFKVDRAAYGHIQDLDQGKPFQEGTAIILRPASKGQTLKATRKHARRWRETQEGKTAVQLGSARQREKRAVVNYDLAVKNFEKVSKAPGTAKFARAQRERVSAGKKLKTARKAVKSLSTNFATIRNAGTARPRKPHHFDLTSRNGAAGHYNFTRNNEQVAFAKDSRR